MCMDYPRGMPPRRAFSSPPRRQPYLQGQGHGMDYRGQETIEEEDEMWLPPRQPGTYLPHLNNSVEGMQRSTGSYYGRSPSPPDLRARERMGGSVQSAPPQQTRAQFRRSGGGRRLPATPTQPSTLNIDSLANISQQPTVNDPLIVTDTAANSTSKGPSSAAASLLSAAINFPKLNPSPSRANLHSGGRKGARLPEVPMNRGRRGGGSGGGGLRQGTWSRSLDDPVAFEEAVLAGRGTRQLPTVGPQQLASARGRGRPVGGLPRRELPRPGTTIGFSTVSSNHGYPMKHEEVLSESDGEDWC